MGARGSARAALPTGLQYWVRPIASIMISHNIYYVK